MTSVSNKFALCSILLLSVIGCSKNSEVLEKRLNSLKVGDLYDVYMKKPRKGDSMLSDAQIRLGVEEMECFKSFESEWDITSSDKDVYIHVDSNDFFIVLSYFKNNLKYIHTMNYQEGNDVLQYESNIFRLTCNLNSLNSLGQLR